MGTLGGGIISACLKRPDDNDGTELSSSMTNITHTPIDLLLPSNGVQ